MKNITTPEQALAQQAAYRKTCGARRRGKVIETQNDGIWTVDKEFKSINKAKAACHGGTYNGAKLYVF